MRAVSLFSGAGGLDTGAVTAGIKIVACVENDRDCIATLKQNRHFSKAKIFDSDISKFNFKKLRASLGKKEPLVVIGGPPCQPFSKNGYWVKNVNRLIDEDPRNLIGEFFRGVEELKANAFMLENVESLAHPTNSHMLKYIMDRSEANNYAIQIIRVNAADYGVPQRRKRIFVFGYKNRKAPSNVPAVTHYDPQNPDLLNDDLPPYEGVEKFITPFAGNRFREAQEDASEGTYYFELKNVPPGKNYIHLASLNGYGGRHFRPGSRFWNFLLKLHPKLPSWTIAAQPGPWVGPFHWKNRRLRVPEIAAIQTFPAGYKFAGNRRSIQKQIGNAVPPLLAEHMAKHLKENY